jgi:hypothetical protein
MYSEIDIDEEARARKISKINILWKELNENLISKQDMLEIFDISKNTLNKLFKLPGAPLGKNLVRRKYLYDVEEVLNFMRTARAQKKK